jgi:hypothetical protein
LVAPPDAGSPPRAAHTGTLLGLFGAKQGAFGRSGRTIEVARIVTGEVVLTCICHGGCGRGICVGRKIATYRSGPVCTTCAIAAKCDVVGCSSCRSPLVIRPNLDEWFPASPVLRRLSR